LLEQGVTPENQDDFIEKYHEIIENPSKFKELLADIFKNQIYDK